MKPFHSPSKVSDKCLQAPTPLALCQREKEVLSLIAQGYGSQQIAEGRYWALATVKDYRRRLLARMQCKNRADLTQYAADHQLLAYCRL